ncbi:MAG: glycosyltransferase family 2 protein [Candidatus Micrarchaeota archaeon]|nr:glycosyltransferase family 2 protein [Candidatus Micrarchaeota archaeon]
MKKSPLVVIMMPNQNSASLAYKGKSIMMSCLESLKKTRYENYRVVVADNGSSDNSRQMASRFKGVEFLVKKTREEYGGIPRTNNFAIRYIVRRYKPEYIMMFNTDMIVKDPLWLQRIVDLAESDEDIGLVGCKLLYPNGRIQHAGIITSSFPVNVGRGEPDRGQYDYIKEVDGVTAALVLIRTSMLRKVALFDELFYNGFDDTDFCLRVREAGYRIMYIGKSSIIHLEGFASGQSLNQSMRDKSFYGHQTAYAYYIYKNLHGLDRLKALISLFGRGLTMYGIDTDTGSGKAKHIKFRDRPLWRIGVCLKALSDGRRIYRMHRRPPMAF